MSPASFSFFGGNPVFNTHNPTLLQLLEAGAEVRLSNGIRLRRKGEGTGKTEGARFELIGVSATVERPLADDELRYAMTQHELNALEMNSDRRRALKDKLWQWQPSEIESYSRTIDDLLDELTDDQLEEFVGARVSDEEADDEDDEDEEDLDIRYRCPVCGHTWEEQYPSACCSECDQCGTTDIEALMWKGLDDEYSQAQEEEWANCDKCVCGHDPDDHERTENDPKKTASGEWVVIGKCKKKRCKCEKYTVDMSRYQK
jgi:hypothetical protein